MGVVGFALLIVFAVLVKKHFAHRKTIPLQKTPRIPEQVFVTKSNPLYGSPEDD
jgi:hypothetical protein